MNNDLKTILAKGLLEGYVGNSVRGKVQRAGLNLDTSDYSGPEGTYHDEWAADFNGAGQELVTTPAGNKGTRVYAGGTLSADKLLTLGLTKNDVIGKLVYFVNLLKDKTRLDVENESADGDWKYTYKLVRNQTEIPVVVGEEIITFKDQMVFIHYHLISPVI